MEQKEFNNLVELFKNNIDQGINYSNYLIINSKYTSFNEFLLNSKNPSFISCCQKSWSTPKLCAICHTCCKEKGSVLCLDCFINGDHKKHNYSFAIIDSGHCCCGDEKFIDQRGFCCKHRKTDDEPQNTQIDEKQRKICSQIFEAATSDLVFSCIYKPEDTIKLIKWLSEFLKLGSGYCRLIASALCSGNKMKKIFESCDVFTKDLSQTLASFLWSLSSDSLFAKNLSETLILEYSTVLKIIIRSVSAKVCVDNFSPLICILYSTLQKSSIALSMMDSNIPWWDLVVDGLEMHFKIASRVQVPCDKFDIDKSSSALVNSVGEIIQNDNQKANVSKFFLRIVDFLSKYALFPEIHMKISADPGKYFSMLFFQQVAGYIGSFLLKMNELPDPKPLFGEMMKLINTIEDKESEWSKEIVEKDLFTVPVYVSGHTSTNLTLHILLMSYLWKNPSQARSILEIASTGYLDTFSDFCRSLMLLPVRLFAFIDAKDSQIVDNIPMAVTFLLNTITTSDGFPLRVLPLFALIQVCLGVADDKEKLMKTIAGAYGIFNDSLKEKGNICKYRFAFFKFIESLLTCKDSLLRNLKSLGSQIILISSLAQDSPIDEIENNVSTLMMERTEEYEAMLELLKITTSADGSIAKPKSFLDISPCSPCATLSSAINCLQTIISSNEDAIHDSNFLPIIQEEGFDFESVLLSPTLMSSIFLALNDKSIKSAETLQIIIHLLIERSKVENDEVEGDPPYIEAANEMDLIEKLPTKFKSIMSATIKYKDEPEASIVSLLESLGNLGQRVLQRLDINYQVKEIKPNLAVNKKRANAAKEKALRQIEETMGFWSYEACPIECGDEIKCIVCNRTGAENEFVVPSLIYPTHLPNYVHEQNTGKLEETKYISIEICDHLYHIKCLDTESKYFKCPSDRLLKNSVLPAVGKCLADVTKEQYDIAINSVGKSGYQIDPQLILNSLVGVLETTEMRARFVPNCLKVPKTNLSFVSFIIILCILKDAFDINKETDPLKRCIIAGISAAAEEDSYKGFIEEFNKQINEVKENRLIFARQAAILIYFGFDHPLSEDCEVFHNFNDEYLSIEHLSEFFKVQIDHMELKPFEFKPLPEELYQFALPPFNIDIEDMSRSLCYCILTGKVFEMKHFKKNNIGEFLFFVVISGPNIGEMVIYSKFFNKEIKVKSVYLDMFGEEDIGLENGRKTTLNKPLLNHYKELLLSGEWTSLIEID